MCQICKNVQNLWVMLEHHIKTFHLNLCTELITGAIIKSSVTDHKQMLGMSNEVISIFF